MTVIDGFGGIKGDEYFNEKLPSKGMMLRGLFKELIWQESLTTQT